MVLSHAELDIIEGSEAAFERAVAQGREVISAAEGFISLRVGRCVESPSRYLVLVEWESVEAHTVGFQSSELFSRWRELVGPHIAGTYRVEHLQPLAGAVGGSLE